MLDSGASQSVMNWKAAESLGLTSESPEVTKKGYMKDAGQQLAEVWTPMATERPREGWAMQDCRTHTYPPSHPLPELFCGISHKDLSTRAAAPTSGGKCLPVFFWT